MYTAGAQTRNIIIKASLLLLDTTSMEQSSYTCNKLLSYHYQSFDYLPRSILFYLAYITLVFLASSPIEIDSDPSCPNTARRRYHLTSIARAQRT